MSYFNVNLKFGSREEMIKALIGAGFEEMEGVVGHLQASLLELPEGCINHATGETRMVEGVEEIVMETVKGFHANVRTSSVELVEALKPFTVEVATPQFVWAS